MSTATPALTDAFREVMARVCTPVTVVTAMTGDRPHGTTVSAFASLSMRPPMVLISLDAGSDLLVHVRAGRRFGVNVLSSPQSALATAFARKGAAKFEGVAWVSKHGLPYLVGASGWLACEVSNLVPGGDHMIVLGTVVAAEIAAGDPLTYYARAFGTHAALA